MNDKKPDNFAEAPGLLPYGSNVGAPSIKPLDLTSFKKNGLDKVNKVFDRRYKEIVERAETLRKSFLITQTVYMSPNINLNRLWVKYITYMRIWMGIIRYQ